MSRDHTLRSLARRADSGDLDSQARSLLERVRAGTLTRERLELAAYCHSRAAELAAEALEGGPLRPWCSLADRMTFPAWTMGLGRWTPDVQVRAGAAACRRAIEVRAAHSCEHCPACGCDDGCLDCGGVGAVPGTNWETPCEPCGGTGREPHAPRAVDAVEAWLACPCERHRRIVIDLGLGEVGMRSLAHGPWRFLCSAVYVYGDPRGHSDEGVDFEETFRRAAWIATEAAVGEAICSALIAWALGPAPAPPAPHPDPDPEPPPTPPSSLDGATP